MDLERAPRLLKALGNPHLNLPPVIHVAGTNGKGSTIATLRSLLEASGKTVHCYTSPHLVHPTERIRLAGIPISSGLLAETLEECLSVNKGQDITFFEIFTCAAFLVMSRIEADYVLLETGMGGRLDVTNVIPDPLCSVITKISKDHTEYLGNDLSDIAAEKAGILKAGRPCVVGCQNDPVVFDVIQNISRGLSPVAPVYMAGSHWRIVQGHDDPDWYFDWQGEPIKIVEPNLTGAHQMENIGAALAAYRIIMGADFDPKLLSPQCTDNPLQKIFWPARLQQMQDGAFDAPDGWDVWVDGGHNDSAAQALADQMQKWQEDQPDKPIHLVVAMVARKDAAAFLAPLVPHVASVTCTTIPDTADSMSAKALYNTAKSLNFNEIYCAPDYKQALSTLYQRHSGRPACVLLTGSLYFAGKLL